MKPGRNGVVGRSGQRGKDSRLRMDSGCVKKGGNKSLFALEVCRHRAHHATNAFHIDEIARIKRQSCRNLPQGRKRETFWPKLGEMVHRRHGGFALPSCTQRRAGRRFVTGNVNLFYFPSPG